MSAYTFPLFVVVSVFMIASLAAAWWHQRRYIRYLQAQLVYNDQSRRALAEQLLRLQQQLEAAAPTDILLGDDAAGRRRELERLLDVHAFTDDHAWQETQPLEAAAR